MNSIIDSSVSPSFSTSAIGGRRARGVVLLLLGGARAAGVRGSGRAWVHRAAADGGGFGVRAILLRPGLPVAAGGAGANLNPIVCGHNPRSPARNTMADVLVFPGSSRRNWRSLTPLPPLRRRINTLSAGGPPSLRGGQAFDDVDSIIPVPRLGPRRGGGGGGSRSLSPARRRVLARLFTDFSDAAAHGAVSARRPFPPRERAGADGVKFVVSRGAYGEDRRGVPYTSDFVDATVAGLAKAPPLAAAGMNTQDRLTDGPGAPLRGSSTDSWPASLVRGTPRS